jgi:Sulphur transport
MINIVNPILALVISFCMGLVIQRGGVCTVAAIHELIHKRTTNRIKALIETSLWVLAGELILMHIGISLPIVSNFQISLLTVLGAILLGFGATINGACAVGTIARIGNGEWDFLAFIPGFLFGVVLIHGIDLPILFPMPVGTKTIPAFDSWLIAVCLALILARGYFLSKKGFHPYVLTVFIGIFFLGLIAIDKAWSYTDLLTDLAMSKNHNMIYRLSLFVALLAGAIVSGKFQSPGNRSLSKLSPTLIKRFIGGAIVGAATLILPGSHDSLILLYMPMLLGYAWLGFAVMASTILIMKFGLKKLEEKSISPKAQ